VEIIIDGERRMVRNQVPVSVALFEGGQGRPEDVLYCPDGSCGRCQITVDGVKKLACQTLVHRGMAMRLEAPPAPGGDALLCPCLGVSVEEIVERIRQGQLRSPEAVLSVSRVGEGKCHGQLCMEAFRRVIQKADPALHESAEGWLDWRFPWSDWKLG
jgi:bacterioferritin-associated ferredoxin